MRPQGQISWYQVHLGMDSGIITIYHCGINNGFILNSPEGSFVQHLYQWNLVGEILCSMLDVCLVTHICIIISGNFTKWFFFFLKNLKLNISLHSEWNVSLHFIRFWYFCASIVSISGLHGNEETVDSWMLKKKCWIYAFYQQQIIFISLDSVLLYFLFLKKNK